MRVSAAMVTGLAVGAACVAVHGAASAGELVVGAESSVEYDSNVFRTENGKEQDGAVVFGPILRLREQHRAFKYDLSYQPNYEQYFTIDNISGFEQRLRANGTYDLSPTTQIGAKNNFYLLRSIGRQAFVTDLTLAPVVENTREQVMIDEYGASLTHLFTQRVRSSLNFEGYLYEPEDDSPSSLTNGVDTSTLYSLSRQDRIGGGVGFTNQRFDQTIAEDTTTRFYRAYASWEHDFDETFTFSIQAGPTWIDPDSPSTSDEESVLLLPSRETGGQRFLINPLTCPMLEDGAPFLDGSCESLPTPLTAADAENVSTLTADVPVTGASSKVSGRLTYFGAFNVSKRWETVNTTLGYRRTNGTTSGTGASTLNDSVFGTVQWRPDRLWNFILTARWDRQKSASDVVIPVQVLSPFLSVYGVGSQVSEVRNVKVKDAIDIKTTSLFLTVERRITKRLFTFARGSWTDQSSKRENFNSNSYTDFRAGLGLRYEFDPIEVPFL